MAKDFVTYLLEGDIEPNSLLGKYERFFRSRGQDNSRYFVNSDVEHHEHYGNHSTLNPKYNYSSFDKDYRYYGSL